MKWQRLWWDDGNNCIAGYRSGDLMIYKIVPAERADCDITKQPSEKASSWDLYRKRKRIGSYLTLREAKKKAESIPKP